MGEAKVAGNANHHVGQLHIVCDDIRRGATGKQWRVALLGK
tara:strand:- start:79 stop:201 length:123 start_codon:yes stop_codon:yes gene_type:complete